MREPRILLHAVAAVVGLVAAAVAIAIGIGWRVEAGWLQVVVVAIATAAGTAHGSSVVHVVFRLADPPTRVRLDEPGSSPRPQPDLVPPQGTMRGGAIIGALERASTILAIAAAQPAIVAAIVAIKGVGRFGELAGREDAAARMRERFLVGSLASLTIAGLWGLAAWLLVR